jgi:hypothetical protein
MTPTETVMLCRFVKALCPQQAIDTYTPDAWHEVLGHLDLADCKQAVVSAARRKPFIAPAEIISAVATARSARRPHSVACRDGGCVDCRVSWCMCACHPRAVEALTRPRPAPTQPAVSGARRFDPAAIQIGREVD